MFTIKRINTIRNSILKNEVAVRIIKNSSWLVGDKVFTMLIGVFVTAIVARYLGPGHYGEFNYALSFVTLFTAFSTLGLETLTVKAIVNEEYDEGTILCTSLILRVIGGILLTIIAGIAITYIEPNDKNLHVLVLIMSLTMVVKSLEVIEYWIQAYQKAKISSIIRMSAYVIVSSIKIAFVVFGGSLFQYALIYFFDALIIGISLLIAYYKYRDKKHKWKLNTGYAKDILSQSWYLIISGFMVTIYMQIDKIMLGNMMPDKIEVGIYSAATAVAQMWFFVPMAIITSFKPVIMGKKKQDEQGYLNTVQMLYTIVAWLGICFGVFILVFSNPIISILYGASYQKAANILSISVWAGTFAMLGSARSVWTVTEGLQNYNLVYVASGAFVNIFLNYFLIPSYYGYGAALTTLISQITAVILVPLFFKKTRISSIMLMKSFTINRLKIRVKNSKH